MTEPIINDGILGMEFLQTSQTFLNQSINICGPSSSGKTTYVQHIRSLLQPHIGAEVIVSPFCGTDEYINDPPRTAVFSQPRFCGDASGLDKFIERITNRQKMVISAAGANTDPRSQLLLVIDDCREFNLYSFTEGFLALVSNLKTLGMTLVVCTRAPSQQLRNTVSFSVCMTREYARGLRIPPTMLMVFDISRRHGYFQMVYSKCADTVRWTRSEPIMRGQ